MQIYLPIAEISLNVILLLSIGGAVGLSRACSASAAASC